MAKQVPHDVGNIMGQEQKKNGARARGHGVREPDCVIMANLFFPHTSYIYVNSLLENIQDRAQVP